MVNNCDDNGLNHSSDLADHDPCIKTTTVDGVRMISLNRPSDLNALNECMTDSLSVALREAGADDAVRSIVIRGEGPAFCAGTDLAAMRERLSQLGRYLTEDQLEQRERERLGARNQLVVSLLSVEKPTVAALHGYVIGAGLGLALACDFRICEKGTVVRAGYPKLGLPGDWGTTQLLPRYLGIAAARRVLVLGDDISIGDENSQLADEVVEKGELQASIAHFTSRLNTYSSQAIIECRKLLVKSSVLEQYLDAETEAVLRCERTQFFRSAVIDFGQKSG